jgi:hypothetical protein
MNRFQKLRAALFGDAPSMVHDDTVSSVRQFVAENQRTRVLAQIRKNQFIQMQAEIEMLRRKAKRIDHDYECKKLHDGLTIAISGAMKEAEKNID